MKPNIPIKMADVEALFFDFDGVLVYWGSLLRIIYEKSWIHI